VDTEGGSNRLQEASPQVSPPEKQPILALVLDADPTGTVTCTLPEMGLIQSSRAVGTRRAAGPLTTMRARSCPAIERRARDLP